MEFNAKEVKDQVVRWIRGWFEENGKGRQNLFKLKPIPHFEYTGPKA